MLTKSVIALCAVLALSNALPRHHFWTWSHQVPDGIHKAYKSDVFASVQDATVSKMDLCDSVVGELDNNGVKIRRSYNLCSQENPAPGAEDVIACYYTTAACCIGTGLLAGNETVSANGLSVAVQFYSTGDKTDLCFSAKRTNGDETPIPSCVTGSNCIPQCTGPDPVCLNQTLAGDESSCSNLVCKCAKGYAPPDCCKCEDGYSKVDGKCETLCLKNCALRDAVLGCTKCRPGYAPLPECCKCDTDYYETPDGTCEDPCGDNIVSCQDGVCTCKAGFGGPACCQCRKFAVANGCTDDGCQCQAGYAAPTCCDCDPGYYRAADGTCKLPCTENTVSCQGGVCTCKTGFGGPGCCQCRDYAVADSCTDTGCKCQEGYLEPTCCNCDNNYYRDPDGTCKEICEDSAITCSESGCTECKPGYTGPGCCECDADYYRSEDGTCESPCKDNIISCQGGVCTCKTGFGGPNCCQCRDYAVAGTCTETACQCQDGYAAPTCCDCDSGYYRAANGTCTSPCKDNVASCQNGVCTCKTGYGGPGCCLCSGNAASCTGSSCVCLKGFTGSDCCSKSCTGVQDIYFVVDTTLSNFATAFCEEMYALELITESLNPQTGLEGTRIGAYIYPLHEDSADSGMRLFKPGEDTCVSAIEEFNTLMQAVSRGVSNALRPYVLGSATYPAPALNLVAEDINADITSGASPADRPRVIVTLTDGGNDGSPSSLVSALNQLKSAGSKTTLIAAGIATAISTDNIVKFTAGVQMLAGGVAANTVIAQNSGTELGLSLVDVMERNGVLCADQAQDIRDRIPQTNNNVYCRCNLKQMCKQVCPTVPGQCKLPPTSKCSAEVAAFPARGDHLEEEILEAVENVLRGYDRE